MNDQAEQERWRTIQRVAGRLNGDRGKMKTAYRKVGRGKKAGVQFDPCRKADVYLAALYPRSGSCRPDNYVYIPVDTETPIEKVRALAANTHCPCHPNWTEADLLAVEEGREPEAHAAEDKRAYTHGDPSKVDPEVAERALALAGGDRKAAYSRVVQIYNLRPPFDNADLQAWYDR